MVRWLRRMADGLAWTLFVRLPKLAKVVRPLMWPAHRAIIDQDEEQRRVKVAKAWVARIEAERQRGPR